MRCSLSAIVVLDPSAAHVDWHFVVFALSALLLNLSFVWQFVQTFGKVFVFLSLGAMRFSLFAIVALALCKLFLNFCFVWQFGRMFWNVFSLLLRAIRFGLTFCMTFCGGGSSSAVVVVVAVVPKSW